MSTQAEPQIVVVFEKQPTQDVLDYLNSITVYRGPHDRAGFLERMYFIFPGSRPLPSPAPDGVTFHWFANVAAARTWVERDLELYRTPAAGRVQ